MDYNWLLTTIAQSSAALVGISSGFIILRISLYINKKSSIENQINDSGRAILENDRRRHGDIKNTPDHFPLKQHYNKLKNELSNLKFPNKIWIGIIGIVWLMGFSIYYPVTLIPNDSLGYDITWGFCTPSFLKNTFFIGLLILLSYLLSEIIYVAIYQFKTKKQIKSKVKLKSNDT